ncbi:hypothetical protein HYZ70_03720 [Candidatus Curtissbacteria bacterium]|nr:hypothetical protein [Candidatus Curtissbacteria bacterium]
MIMPFKTRRQKLAAAARRFTFSQSGLVSYEVSSGKKEEPKTAHEEQPGSFRSPAREIENLSYVRTDFLRILLLATLIIAAQILLSFVRA